MKGRDTASPESRLAGRVPGRPPVRGGSRADGRRGGRARTYFQRFPLEVVTPLRGGYRAGPDPGIQRLEAGGPVQAGRPISSSTRTGSYPARSRPRWSSRATAGSIPEEDRRLRGPGRQEPVRPGLRGQPDEPGGRPATDPGQRRSSARSPRARPRGSTGRSACLVIQPPGRQSPPRGPVQRAATSASAGRA